jgi:phosphoglycerol geranylgeranyltransferase
MNILNYIQEKRKEKPLHFTLLDPDKREPEKNGELAALAAKFGSDAIMVGGSNGDVYGERLNNTVKLVKEKSRLPVILFPNSAQQLSPEADALFFMSLFNSRDPRYIIGEQAKGSLLVNKYGLEPLSMAYLIVESGATTSAGYAGDVRPIPREKPEFALGYALAAKYFGMRFIYLEAGSGAKHSVPKEMITLVKKNLGQDMLLIVGGGIRDPQTAKEKIQAGADIIVTGTIAEDDQDALEKIIKAVKG